MDTDDQRLDDRRRRPRPDRRRADRASACRRRASSRPPPRFPEPLEVGMRRRAPRDDERDVGARHPARRGEPIAEGRFVHVFVDDETRRPVPIPDGIRAAIERDLRRLIAVAYRPGGMTTCHPERWSTMTAGATMPDPARARRRAAGGVAAPRAPRRGGRRHVVRAGHRRRAQQPHVPRSTGARVPLVVRRPPLGHVLSTAHDMAREHRVISALPGSRVPVPPAVDLVDDTDARGHRRRLLRHGPRRGHRARPPVAEHRPTPPTSCAP